jgi:hypothetical protein
VVASAGAASRDASPWLPDPDREPRQAVDLPPRHPHLFVDFDLVRRHRDGWAISNADTDPTRLFHYRFAERVFDGSRVMSFADVGDVVVPADPEAFLTAVYGDWSRPQAKTDYLYGPLNLEVEVLPPRN